MIDILVLRSRKWHHEKVHSVREIELSKTLKKLDQIDAKIAAGLPFCYADIK